MTGRATGTRSTLFLGLNLLCWRPRRIGACGWSLASSKYAACLEISSIVCG